MALSKYSSDQEISAIKDMCRFVARVATPTQAYMKQASSIISGKLSNYIYANIQDMQDSNPYIGSYSPFKYEVDISSIKFPKNTRVCYPSIENDNMVFIGEDRAICIPSLVIVPTISYNQSCYRIGHGKGHYDKYFLHNKTTKIGVGFDVNMVIQEADIAFSHDIKLDIIFTETKILRSIDKVK